MNDYFRFKQFTVQQEKAAMKVTTDACLFGAWVADQVVTRKLKIQHILDIGAGTGLLSLMLAQKTEAIIDAVEIDDGAFEQALGNFSCSPWQERLTAYHSNILNFEAPDKYDLIISNPPFFKGDLKSGNIKKDAAKHDITLTLEQLINVMDNTITDNGCMAILLPDHRSETFIHAAQTSEIYVLQNTKVRQTPSHPYFRSMLLLSRTKKETINQEIIIKNADSIYNSSFIKLLQDYYLYL
ncbi:MAG: methyltransferase [Ferruginibacter sp.]